MTSSVADRIARLAWFGLGALPFASTWRFPPSASFWSDWIAVVLALVWIGCETVPSVSSRRPATGSDRRGAGLPVALAGLPILALLLLVQLLSGVPTLRGSAGLAIGLLVIASAGGFVSASLQGQPRRAEGLLDAFAFGLVAALVLNAIVVGLERAGWRPLGLGIFPAEPPSRALGLVGQPNQLGVFATMAVAAALHLRETGRLRTLPTAVLVVAGAVVVAATQSRAGAACWCLVAACVAGTAWLAGRRRDAVVLAAGGLAVLLLAEWAWARWLMVDSAAAAADRVFGEGNATRLQLWRDALALVARHPWTGVGFGNFMTARWFELADPMLEPNARHPHNLVSALAVEFGLPAALVLTGLLGWLVVCAVRALRPTRSTAAARLAAVLVLVLVCYSMVEFPLWYAYFLIPFSLVAPWVPQPAVRGPAVALGTGFSRALVGLAAALALLVAVDYRRGEAEFSDLHRRQSLANGAPVHASPQRAGAIALATLFDGSANFLYSTTLDFDDFLVDQKLEVSALALAYVVDDRTVARYVAYLAMAGRDDEARRMLDATRRNPTMRQRTLASLETFARLNPAIRRILEPRTP